MSVFLSYVQENRAEVQRLARALRNYGLTVWMDVDEIKPGYRWKEAISDAISHGEFFIACFSTDYCGREKTDMNEELILATEELRLRPRNRAWFIPVLLSECTLPSLSIGPGETLSSIQVVKLYANWDGGILRLISVLDPNSERVDQLLRGLSDKSARARIAASDQLAKIGKLARRAVPALIETLRDRKRDGSCPSGGSVGQDR